MERRQGALYRWLDSGLTCQEGGPQDPIFLGIGHRPARSGPGGCGPQGSGNLTGLPTLTNSIGVRRRGTIEQQLSLAAFAANLWVAGLAHAQGVDSPEPRPSVGIAEQSSASVLASKASSSKASAAKNSRERNAASPKQASAANSRKKGAASSTKSQKKPGSAKKSTAAAAAKTTRSTAKKSSQKSQKTGQAKAATARSVPAVSAHQTPSADLKRESSGIDPKRGLGTRNIGSSELARNSTPDGPAVAQPVLETTLTEEQIQRAGGDLELAKLRAAELLLFPRPLRDFGPGRSWHLPEPLESSRPEVVSGAPPSSGLLAGGRASPPVTHWLRGLSMPNLPVRLEGRVQRYLSFYRDSPSGRSIARIWAKKSGRFQARLRAELANAGLPTDLVWLSMVESAHNPTIVSYAGAAGLWQFMPDSGRAYGLIIDRWVDERLDPERSTQAACRFLSDLYRRFGTWELAMAAYNMGYGGLSRAIRKYNTNDFWELARYEAGLPWETTLYVPKVLATAIVMSNRRAFGIEDVEAELPELFDTVLVGAGVPLREIARLASVPEVEIAALNPQYLAGRTPPTQRGRNWPVRVPRGRGSSVTQALARGMLIDESLFAYLVKAGESIEAIARSNATTEAVIRSINAIGLREDLAPGGVLLVPRSERQRQPADRETQVVVLPRDLEFDKRKRVFYEVQSGDSLERVADVFQVTRSDLLTWNALDINAHLQAGMVLQLLVSEPRDLSHVRHVQERNAQILVLGSSEFFEHFEAQNGKKRLIICARDGDSLAAIGKRYGLSVGSMERVNRRSRRDSLRAGEPVVVYTERSNAAPGDHLYEQRIDPPAIEVRVTEVPTAQLGASGATGTTSVASGNPSSLDWRLGRKD